MPIKYSKTKLSTYDMVEISSIWVVVLRTGKFSTDLCKITDL